VHCILKACPWAKDGNCKTLGECGAAYALSRAAEPGGYQVIERDNRTISALHKAGFVTLRRSDDDYRLVTVVAKREVMAFAVKQGRIEAAA
jgi:hypothetical protein